MRISLRKQTVPGPRRPPLPIEEVQHRDMVLRQVQGPDFGISPERRQQLVDEWNAVNKGDTP